jgi:hypothetical protein
MGYDSSATSPVTAGSPYREIQFDGDTIVAGLLEGEGTAVPVRMICQALGMDVASQSERIQAHEVLARGLEGHDAQISQAEGVMDAMLEQLAKHTTITGPQQEAISRAIRQLAVRYQKRTGKEIFGKLFGEFCMHFGTLKNGLLPAGKYREALLWVRARASELLPDDPEAQSPIQAALL